MRDLVAGLTSAGGYDAATLKRAGALLGPGVVPEPEPRKKRTTLAELLTAKAESDRRNYAAKHAILRRLLTGAPDDFFEDSRARGIVGVTHRPTGFRIHAPESVVSGKLRKTAGLFGPVARFARSHPAATRSIAGAGLGAGLTAYELNSGIADPILSPNAKWTLLATNMIAAGGAPHGSTWMNPTTKRPNWLRNTARVGALAYGPRLASYGDASYKTIKAVNTADRHQLEDAALPLLDPGGRFADRMWHHMEPKFDKLTSMAGQRGEKLIGDLQSKSEKVLSDAQTAATRQLSESSHEAVSGMRDAAVEGARSFAPEFGKTLGLGVGGLTGGSLAGWLGGKALGKIVAPDDASLDYRRRRDRERWRGIVELLGSTVGGAAGMYGMQRYGPAMLAHQTSASSPPASAK